MWVLKIIAGKYQGLDLPLLEGKTVTVGRSNDCELMLNEDMVSRRHAQFYLSGGRVVLQDLKSTNGCFVNGVRISDEVALNEGDRILLGTSILKLIQREGEVVGPAPGPQPAPQPTAPQGPQARATILHAAISPPAPDGTNPGAQAPSGNQLTMPPMSAASLFQGPPGATQQSSVAAPPAAAAAQPRSNPRTLAAGGIVGSLSELPLVDLLQVFGGTRRSGKLDLELFRGDERERGGTMWLKDGQIVFAEIEGLEGLHPEKAAYRILRWNEGYYSFDSRVEVPSFDVQIQDTTEGVIMEAMRVLDELAALGDDVPSHDTTLTIKRPLVAQLRELTPEQLDALQLVINYGQVETIVGEAELTEVDIMKALCQLLRGDYVEPIG